MSKKLFQKPFTVYRGGVKVSVHDEKLDAEKEAAYYHPHSGFGVVKKNEVKKQDA